MKDKVIKIVCEDWIAIYSQGYLREQGHSIHTNEMFRIGQENPDAELILIEISESDQIRYDLCDFPEKQSDLPIEVLDLIY